MSPRRDGGGVHLRKRAGFALGASLGLAALGLGACSSDDDSAAAASAPPGTVQSGGAGTGVAESSTTALPTTDSSLAGTETTEATEMTETTATTEATEMTEATVVGPPSTKAQIIPDDELAPQLLDMFIQNFGDVNFAGCVHQQVFDALARGEIATVDIANYIRNLVTGPMQAALVSIQDAATCRR